MVVHVLACHSRTLEEREPLAGDMALMVFGIQCMALALRTSCRGLLT
jgi:hypothetical protein